MIIVGKNAVTEFLKGNQKVNELFVLSTADKKMLQNIKQLAQNRNVDVKLVTKDVLDKMSVKHQGVLLKTEDYKYADNDEIVKICEAKADAFFLILDGIEDPHNLGSIIRVGECANVDGVIIPKNRSVEVNSTVIKTSAGASAHIKVFRVNSLNDTIRTLKKLNVFVYALEAEGESIYSTNLTGAIALIVGSEGFGVSRLTKELSDEIISLPLMGKVNSLNASVATGIAVYEAIRQRSKV